MRTPPLLALLLILAVASPPALQTAAADNPADAALARVPDDAFLVAEFPPDLILDERLAAWFERASPAAAARLRAGREIYRSALALVLCVQAFDRPAPLLLVVTKGSAESALPAFREASPGRAVERAGDRLLVVGDAEAIRTLLAAGGGRLFLDVRRRVKKPRAWLSLKPDKLARVGLLARLSTAEHPFLKKLFSRLERTDLVFHEGPAGPAVPQGLHLTVNVDLGGPADAGLARAVDRISAAFRNFLRDRAATDSVPPYAAGESVRFMTAAHPRGLIIDLAPFPDAAVELYLFLFHPTLEFNVRDWLDLAALSELILRFDRAELCLDRALTEGGRLNAARERLARDRLNVARSHGEAAAPAEAELKLAATTAAVFERLVADLKLQCRILGGHRAEVEKILATPGGAECHPGAAALLKITEVRP